MNTTHIKIGADANLTSEKKNLKRKSEPKMTDLYIR